MEYGWEFLWSVIASSAGTAILLGALGWLCRGQISHWLNKDMEAVKAQHQRDLQREKVEFERQLEAYKVTLIAEAERAKAAQSVRTAGALRMVDRKFEALNDASKHVRGITSSGVAYCSIDFPTTEIALAQSSVISEELKASAIAIEGVAAFIPHEEYKKMLNLQVALVTAFRERGLQLTPLAPTKLELLKAYAIPAQREVNQVLQRHIAAMMEMH